MFVLHSGMMLSVLSQEEKADESGWSDPAGFHLIPLPFADDIRTAPVEKAFRGLCAFNLAVTY
jgi:ATP-dependent DNA helicase 2 subunit 1